MVLIHHEGGKSLREGIEGLQLESRPSAVWIRWLDKAINHGQSGLHSDPRRRFTKGQAACCEVLPVR